MAAQDGAKIRLLPILAGALVVWGGVGLLRDRSQAATEACGPEEPACHAPVTNVQGRAEVAGPPVLEAAAACRNVGYLCAELATSDRMRVRRWRDFSGTMVVHVPRPDFEDGGDAVRLQQAAVRGLQVWNGQPFQILTDLRGDRDPHFAVRWSRNLSGNRIGVAHTQWSSVNGLSVAEIELSTRSPFTTGVHDVRQVQLTAAHEMGHALGLPHSDSERDVMYPTNTATSLSAQDYRTMESLYALEDGTEIVR